VSIRFLKTVAGTALLVAGIGWAEPAESLPTPTPQTPEVPAQPAIQKRVVLEGDWRRTGRAKLVFQKESETSAVEEIRLQATLKRDSWFTEFQCASSDQGLPHYTKVRVGTALLNSTSAFAEWQQNGEEQQVATGLHASLPGDHKLDIEHRKPLQTETQPTTAVNYRLPLVGGSNLTVVGLTQGERQEIKGKLLQENTDGWGWEAAVKTEYQPQTGGHDLWNNPQVEGRLRWVW